MSTPDESVSPNAWLGLRWDDPFISVSIPEYQTSVRFPAVQPIKYFSWNARFITYARFITCFTTGVRWTKVTSVYWSQKASCLMKMSLCIFQISHSLTERSWLKVLQETQKWCTQGSGTKSASFSQIIKRSKCFRITVHGQDDICFLAICPL